MTNLNSLSITEALKKLEKREISSVELTKAHIDSMNQNSRLNAYITETPDIALQQAEASDLRRSKGGIGKMEGIPVAIKDLFCTKNIRTTAGSKMLDKFIPQYESTVTQKLLDAGIVTLGKTSLDEFAMGSSNTTSHFGSVINPWKAKGESKDLVPGGSSGGSAAAVAAYMAMAATGTDTGGSIRQPASFCGITGIKPTYGRCSRWGVVAFASSLDQAGVFARNVEDAAIMLEAMAGYDAKDSTSANIEVPAWAKQLKGEVKGLKIGIPKQYDVKGLNAEVKALWEKGATWLKEQGAEIVEIELPHTKYALATYYIIAPAEASSNLARYDGVKYGHRTSEKCSSLDDMYEKTRAEGFGDEVKRRILIGTYVLSHGYYDAYYKKAQRVRTLIAREFEQAFAEVDAILTPTAPTPAFAIGENANDPVAMYLNDVFTIPASMAGLPGMSVPAGLSSNGLPLGLQIIGNAFDEQTVLNVSRSIEQAANFKQLSLNLQREAA